MPIIKSAKKALRQSRKRALANKERKKALKVLGDKIKKEKNAKLIPSFFSLVDKMVRRNIVHKNKASHLKSKISSFIQKP